jgi:hypothetical protein
MNQALLDFYNERLHKVPYDFNDNRYGFKATNGSDISAHMSLLYFLARQCDSVTEFGTRECYSTSAFLLGCDNVTSYDINIYNDIITLQKIVPQWKFIQQDTTDPDFKIEPTDFLFIDSLHTYTQVKLELRQAAYVKRWLGFHDTYSQGTKSLDVPGEEGIVLAINEFLAENDNWEVVYSVPFNHGLTILEKK